MLDYQKDNLKQISNDAKNIQKLLKHNEINIYFVCTNEVVRSKLLNLFEEKENWNQIYNYLVLKFFQKLLNQFYLKNYLSKFDDIFYNDEISTFQLISTKGMYFLTKSGTEISIQDSVSYLKNMLSDYKKIRKE